MTPDEIIKLAREAGFLVDNALFLESVSLFERFAALVAAYEREKQAEQEPVAFQAREIGEGDWFDVGLDEVTRITGIINSPHIDYRWLYTAPVQQVDLTDEEINELWLTHGQGQMMYIHEKFARAIIAADKEKNK